MPISGLRFSIKIQTVK